MGSKIRSILILFMTLLISTLTITVKAQDIGIREGERLLVWIAEAQRPGNQTANNPGELAWVDSAGNFETLTALPPQTTHVMTCGYYDAVSPDGQTTVLFTGPEIGTLSLLRGTELTPIDSDFHALGCAGNGTFEFSADGSRIAYMDYLTSTLDDSYASATLRVLATDTLAPQFMTDNVTAFDLQGDKVSVVRFFNNDKRQAVEAAIVMWDGTTDREIATLFAEDNCEYVNAAIKMLPDERMVLVTGYKCVTNAVHTNWQYYIIDPANRSATQVNQAVEPGSYFTFSRTNAIYSSPDSSVTYFTIPDGITNSTVSLMAVDMNSTGMTPILPSDVVMPRFNPKPYSEGNHPAILSADGQWLGMVRNTPNNDATLTLFDLSVPTLPPIEVSAGSRGDTISDMWFSPDGGKLLYVAGGNEGADNSLWEVDLETGNNFRIRRGRYGLGVQSPDGGRIALINWVPTKTNQPPYATLVIVDIANASETLLFQGGEIVNGDLTGVRFALPILWR